MNVFLRIILIITLLICYKYLPVYEPIGINYILSIFCIIFIGFEIKKVWKSIILNENSKFKIQKICYLTIIIFILIYVILIMHKDYPAGNLRFLRSVLILMTIGISGNIVWIIAKTAINNSIKNSILISFTAISFIGIIEIIFMFISLSHGGGEAYSGKIWGNRYWNPINKFGFRDEDPKNGKNTVFFIGDSFTAGWGVKKIKDRFGEIATEELRKKGKKINEINLGKYGADTRLEYHLFESFKEKTNIKPNHIVLQFFVNDMDKFMPNSTKCVEQPVKMPNWKKAILDGSYLANYINSIYPTQNKSYLPKECDYIEKLKFVYNNDSTWKKEQIQLDKFKNFCDKNNIKMTIVLFPFMEDLTLAKKLGIEKCLISYCKKNKIKLFNVSKYIKNLSQNERQVSLVDSHASAKVHKIIGKNLASHINF